MLKKDDMIPGVLVKVNPVIKSGVAIVKGADQTIPHLTVHTTDVIGMGPAIGVRSGGILKIIKKPTRREGINLATVEVEDGRQGTVYWCELRASCSIYNGEKE